MRRDHPHLKLLGEKIRQMRLKAGLSQLGAAFDAGVSYKHYQDLERGATNPTYWTLYLVAGGLRCSITDFLPEVGDNDN